MTFLSALGALRERWLVVAAGLLVGVVVAAAISLLAPATYAATARVYVSGTDGLQSRAGDYYGDAYLVQQRIAAYQNLMTSPLVLDPAAQAAGLPIAVDQVSVTAASPAPVLQVTLTANDPVAAVRAIDAVIDRFGAVVAQVNGPRGPAATPATSIVDLGRPTPPATRIAPRVGLNLLVGGLVGLAAAAAFVLTRRVLDTTVRSSEEVRAVVGGVALGVLPPPRPGRGAPDGDAARDEAARLVRTRLRLALAGPAAPEDVPAPVVALTAAHAGAGTTTTVRVLGYSFARRSRVLVVDADLRRPSLSVRSGLDGVAGLADVVAGRTSLEAAVTRRDGVDVLPAGTRPDDPDDVLAAPGTARVLGQARDRYDVVLVDTPPLGSVPDAAVLARHLDATVVLCREGETTGTALRSVTAALDEVGARIVGSVLVGSSPGDRAPYGDERGPAVEPGTGRGSGSSTSAGIQPERDPADGPVPEERAARH